MRKEAEKQQRAEKAAGRRSGVPGFFVLWMLLAVPLYLEDGYFNMLQAKTHIAEAGLVWMLLYILVKRLSGRRRTGQPLRFYEAGMIGLAVLAVVSCVLSGDFLRSFTGLSGWGVGGFSIAGFTVCYFYLRDTFSYEQELWRPVILVNILILALWILHSAGVDVLGLHRQLIPSQYYSYVSTLGNTNWAVGYLCLLTPPAVIFYMESSGRSRIVYLLFLLALFSGMILCGCDGVYLGAGLSLFCYIPYMVRKENGLQDTGVLLLFYGLLLLFYGNAPCFSDRISRIDGLAAVLLQPIPAGTAALAGGLLLLPGRRTGTKQRRIAGILSAELTAAAAAAVLLLQTAAAFGSQWGNGRGMIWRESLRIFRNFPLKEKLLGTGPELLGSVYGGLSEQLGRTLLSAHSEPLQVLLSMGLLGAMCFLLLWLGLFADFLRNRRRTPYAYAFGLSLIAYFGQSLVNSQMMLNYPICFVIIMLYYVKTKDSSHE